MKPKVDDVMNSLSSAPPSDKSSEDEDDKDEEEEKVCVLEDCGGFRSVCLFVCVAGP